MTKPSKRALIYSKKLNQWLEESEETIALLEMLHDKREALMKKIQETDPTVTSDEAKGLAEEMMKDPKAAVKLLEDDQDEPAKEEEVHVHTRNGTSEY